MHLISYSPTFQVSVVDSSLCLLSQLLFFSSNFKERMLKFIVTFQVFDL